MANSLINSAPLIVGAAGPGATALRKICVPHLPRTHRRRTGRPTQVSRQWTTGILLLMRWQRRFQKLQERLVPGLTHSRRAKNFTTLLERSLLDDMGISYRLPNQISADRANPW